MKTLIEGYRIFPGEHCGSAAMRALLLHYCGLELPEPAVFGLGSGVDCIYLEGGMDPPVAVFGRTMTLEFEVGSALGVDYREEPEPDDAKAWQVVREEVLAGRPTMLSGDIFYLDYRDYTVHFPAHRFVLLGFDDETEQAFIADRIRPEPEACSYEALRKSRNPVDGPSTQNLWGRFHGTEVGRDLREAAALAIDRAAQRMLGTGGESQGGEDALAEIGPVQVSTGIAGVRRLAHELPAWATRPDARWVASFNGRCIEKFGNGGGNFRRLYAGFLDWARDLDASLVPEAAPALARQAADRWTAVSACLARAAEEGAAADCFEEAAGHAAVIADTEQELFERLADGTGPGPGGS